MGFDYRTSVDWGKQTPLRGHTQTPVHTRTRGKGAGPPQETEPDPPASVRRFCYRAWSITGPESNPGDRVLDEVEKKDNFIALSG